MIACEGCGEEILPGFEVARVCDRCGVFLCRSCYWRHGHGDTYVDWPEDVH